MKLKSKIRIISMAMAMVMLFTACGSTADIKNTEVNSTDVSTDESQVTIQQEESNVVTTPLEEVVPTPEELEQQEWQKYMMPDVDVALNVRVEANVESDIAGKLEKGDRATVLEIGPEWTKIESGQVIGYVNNQYCLYGADALAYAKANCKTMATSTVDGLRIREAQNLECKIAGRLDEGEKIEVDTTAVAEDGWVAVKYSGTTCYVSAEFVTVALEIGTAMTLEEIEERARLEAERKAREEQAKRAAAEKLANNSAMREIDDLTLMAAIIYCEANVEPYETKVAVGAVIVNRMKSAKYGGSLYDVLSRPGQFTPFRSGKLAEVLAKGKANAACYDAAREALAGVDNTDGCLYFNDYNGTREGIRYGGMVFWW